MAITVNGSLCSNNSYINKPCVSVTICTPATSTCQTINDILLDTGDSGLRIFKQVLSVSLTQVTSGGNAVAECIQYADGSSVWGPVKTAGVVLGNEPAVQVPIHVIDSTFGTAPAGCSGAYQIPADAGYNGSLGVSFFAQDCGPTCRAGAGNGVYYACSGATCTGAAVELANQVQNPVALLPVDNNGVIVQLPSVPSSGAPSVNGYLVLGIGTRSNNVPSGVTAYAADAVRQFHHNLQRKQPQRVHRHRQQRIVFPHALGNNSSGLRVSRFGLVLPRGDPGPFRDQQRDFRCAERCGFIPDRQLRYPSRFARQ